MANFAILRVAKMNNFGSLSASGQHNFRERITKNADDERTTLNEIEGAESTSELVKAVSDLLPPKRRKDAVICIEYMISASPEHFGEDWREVKNHGADYFKDAIEWLEKRHGKGNVVCTTVHLDESTPHLAAYVVPRTMDGRLSAKDFVGGRSALSKMQTSFAAEVGVKHGLVRGVERSNAVHQDNAKIAPMTAERLALRKRVKVLEDEVERLVKSAGAGGAALAAAQKALEQIQGDLVKVHGALALATSQAKAEAKAKAQAQDELVNVQSELVSVQGAFEKLQKRYDHTHKTNVQFLGELNQLDCEKKALVAEIDALREERAAAIDPAVEVQGQDGDQKAQKGHQEAQEAFKEKWVGVREATATERQHLPVVDVCGDQAVYSLGRGNFAIHTFAPGEVVPQLRNVTELQKGGIAGR
ncbi:MobV family relaxase [Janthinobacterium sp. CAN_S7]|jgi:DNA repair exonuclease SbcCD ATPase subunit|uniref:MobV family relaxase n=1 Tax=Janthinobacterium sp. CAN_S7 TaxID=3071704 RepID=UPI00319E977C